MEFFMEHKERHCLVLEQAKVYLFILFFLTKQQCNDEESLHPQGETTT